MGSALDKIGSHIFLIHHNLSGLGDRDNVSTIRVTGFVAPSPVFSSKKTDTTEDLNVVPLFIGAFLLPSGNGALL